MTARFVYSSLIRLHPKAFRERFGPEMLWIFDETVGTRGGLALVGDALVSLARQRILRPHPFRHRRPTFQHLVILLCLSYAVTIAMVDFAYANPLNMQVTLYAALIMLGYGLFRRSERRLSQTPLAAPLGQSHLPYRAQLEDSLKDLRGLAFGVIPICLGFLTFNATVPRVVFTLLWTIAVVRLQRCAIRTLQRAIEESEPAHDLS